MANSSPHEIEMSTNAWKTKEVIPPGETYRHSDIYVHTRTSGEKERRGGGRGERGNRIERVVPFY